MKQTNSHLFFCAYKALKQNFEFNLMAGYVLQILIGQMDRDHPSYAAGGGSPNADLSGDSCETVKIVKQ